MGQSIVIMFTKFPTTFSKNMTFMDIWVKETKTSSTMGACHIIHCVYITTKKIKGVNSHGNTIFDCKQNQSSLEFNGGRYLGVMICSILKTIQTKE